MIGLNDNQIAFIEADLLAKGLTFDELREEMLDHVCCMVEFNMIDGTNFSQAYQAALDVFEAEEFKEIQEQTFQLILSKPVRMKKVAMMTMLLIVTMVFTTFGSQIDPPTRAPLESVKITSGFGWRMHPIHKVKKLHKGCDFKAPIGTPIYATADGVIHKAVIQSTGYGNHIKINHDEEYQTVYAQLSEIKVEEGQVVKKGDLIAYSGNSGASTAPHLHYEVIKNGKAVNPEDYFKP